MAFGVIINNKAGRRVTDSTSPNWALRHKLNVTVISGATANIVFTVTAFRPIVFFNGPHFVTKIQSAKQGDQWTFRLYTNSPAGSVISFLIFDDAGAFMPSDVFGIELKDTTGRRTWTLGSKPLILVPAPPYNAQTGSLDPLPAGRSYAICSRATGGSYLTYEGTQVSSITISKMDGLQLSQTSVPFSTSFNVQPPFGSGTWGGGQGLLIADVTNY